MYSLIGLRKRLTKFTVRSYNKKNYFWLLCTVFFASLVALVFVTKLLHSDFLTKFIWALPVIITAFSMFHLWNPFRAGVLLSLFAVSFCIDNHQVWLAILPLLMAGVFMYGWYEIIQKPNDRHLERKFKDI